MPTLTTIGFDADDTLWQNEQFSRLTEARFQALLTEHAPAERLVAHPLEAEKRNLAHYSSAMRSVLCPVWLLRRAARPRTLSKRLSFLTRSIAVYSVLAG